jgi:hypothetical protein
MSISGHSGNGISTGFLRSRHVSLPAIDFGGLFDGSLKPYLVLDRRLFILTADEPASRPRTEASMMEAIG